MQHLEVSCTVLPLKWSLGVRWLMEMRLVRPPTNHLYYMEMLVRTALRGLNCELSEHILIFE